jgi:hypothetical protein
MHACLGGAVDRDIGKGTKASPDDTFLRTIPALLTNTFSAE